jgi:aspartate carbamoyltransferase catalytic subunit
MLDLMTIYQEFGKFEGLKVGIVGDVKHSSCQFQCRSIKKISAKVYFSGPNSGLMKAL